MMQSAHAVHFLSWGHCLLLHYCSRNDSWVFHAWSISPSCASGDDNGTLVDQSWFVAIHCQKLCFLHLIEGCNKWLLSTEASMLYLNRVAYLRWSLSNLCLHYLELTRCLFQSWSKYDRDYHFVDQEYRICHYYSNVLPIFESTNLLSQL